MTAFSQKDEAFPVQFMAANSRIGGIAPLILNLGTRWRLVVNLMLYPREGTPVPSEEVE